mmetsp:Transcript_33221/g.48759  ORF Transcript_33221/g.48759 Transcript_33221/m.48759 type:complete len:87 (+) Transcript_33221:163-423(+)
MTVPILNGFVETAIAGDDASAHDSMISEFVTLTVNNAWQQVVFTFEWKCSTFTPKIAVVSWYPFYNDGAIMVFIKAGMLKILKDFE